MSELSHRFFAGKRLFVAGCGYVGSVVARQGLARAMQVIALTRNRDKATALRAEGVSVIQADLADAAWQAELSGEIDYVLNCVSSGGGGTAAYQHSYYAGMASLLRWVSTTKIGSCVYTSSTSVYPQGDGERVDETAPITAMADERARVLIATENLLKDHAGSIERTFILRLAGIYGPGRHHLLDAVRAGAVLTGSGAQRLNLIHRDDAVAAVWAAFGAPASVPGGIYNVADDWPVAKADLVNWLAARLGQAPARFDASLPSRRGRSVPDRVIENAKIKRELGWRPRYADYRAGYEEILAAL